MGSSACACSPLGPTLVLKEALGDQADGSGLQLQVRPPVIEA